MIESMMTPTLFGQLLIGGLSTATGCVAYFAGKILKNQQDLAEIRHMLQDLARDLKKAKLTAAEARAKLDVHQDEQKLTHQSIIKELSRLSALSEVYHTNWDGEDRRKR